MARRSSTLVLTLLAAAVSGAAGQGYDDLRARAIAACQAIDPADYQTALFFNPDGYRSYYVQSECFQRVAVEFRDDSLCASVRERRAWLSSSWGYSAANCRKLTEAAVAADERALNEVKQGYRRGAVTLRDFRVERNGNGRDFDFIPEFTGAFAHRYVLRFEIVEGDRVMLIDASEFHLDGTNNIRVFVRGEVLTQAIGLPSSRLYTVRATLQLHLGRGSVSGQVSDALIERMFPARDRTQVLVREVRFGAGAV
jgi:hypothetical protein